MPTTFMSIVAIGETPAVQPEQLGLPHLAMAFFLLLIATGIASAAGWLRGRSIAGPDRIHDAKMLLAVLAALGVGVLLWVGTSGAYVATQHRTTPEGPAAEIKLTTTDYAVLGIVPGAVGLLAMLIANITAGGSLPRALGYSWSRLPGGLVHGAVGAMIALPLIFAASIAVQFVYQLVGFQHPEAHELLEAMQGSESPVIRLALIGAAVIVAPLWEELLFRGHLQSLVSGWLSRFGARPGAWPRWIAVVVTSLAFASIHPGWTTPMIFALSILLGYAYERTGNLWVPIVMHALFNGASTFLSLKFGT